MAEAAVLNDTDADRHEAGVPVGYKKTEVGVIPEDWDIGVIEDFASITTGCRNTQDRVEDGRYPFYVRSQKVERINSYSFDGEAVLTAGDGVGTGKIFHYNVGKCDIHQRVYCISEFSEKLLGYYFYLFFSTAFYDRIMKMTAKSSVDSVRREMIAHMLIPIPIRKEQEAIATALNDADALIQSLERLIDKKRQIKQGAMQELLTGKRRLPGFSGEWKSSSLGDICRTIVDGTHFTPTYVESGVPFYSVENVTSDDFLNTRFITREEHLALVRRCKPERGDILLTRIGSIGDTKYIDWDVDASIYVSLALLKFGQEVDPLFVYAYTKGRQFRKDIEDRSLLNAAPRKINMGDISNVPIPVPNRDEQAAISAILADIDAESRTLERKVAKARQIKQGMMQELLTGRVRLV